MCLWDVSSFRAFDPDVPLSSLWSAVRLEHRLGAQWDLQSAEEASACLDVSEKYVLDCLRGHSKGINRVAFSHNGAMLASTSADHTCRVYNVKQKQVMHVLRGHASDVYGVAWRSDSSVLVTGSFDKTLRQFCCSRYCNDSSFLTATLQI